jgi:cell division protein ZapE
LFARGVVIGATSNTPPQRLYEGGLNRPLFVPFIALIEERLDIVEINGPRDYRQQSVAGIDRYLTPLGPRADAAMDAAWSALTGNAAPRPDTLSVLGRNLIVPAAAGRVARFPFDSLCQQPLAAADFLAIAKAYDTILIDHIPVLGAGQRDAARRFVVLIDTLYDEGVALICSAAAPPERLYAEGDGADAFRRTASRLVEMQSEAYARRSRSGTAPSHA